MKPSLVPPILLAVVLASVLTVVAHDVAVPAQQQFMTRGAVVAIEQYRYWISPHLRGVVQCRFKPTCSMYGLLAVKKYGGVRGSWMAVKRVARCNPWTTKEIGTVDWP